MDYHHYLCTNQYTWQVLGRGRGGRSNFYFFPLGIIYYLFRREFESL